MITNPEIQAYLDQFPQDVQDVLNQARASILEVLPTGFEEQLNYGMIGYVVPLSLYPQGYLDDPTVPLPYFAIAKQKHHYAFYSMGLFMIKDLFEKEKASYESEVGKLDHGAACLRFRNVHKIPWKMIQTLASAITVDEYIQFYKKAKGK